MRIRLAEIPVQDTWEASMEKALRAAETKPLPDLVLLPELFTIGYVLESIPARAVTMEQLEALPLAEAAKRLGIWIAGGTFPVRTDKGILNRMPVYDPEGKLVHTADKVHLFRNMGEDKVFIPGEPSATFELAGMAAGASVCYDLRFPELFRMHTLNGARLILLPAEWPHPRLHLFRCLLKARAAEAQVFTAGCNIGGDHLGVRFRGGGAVVHPSGKLIEGNRTDEFTTDHEIDPTEVDDVRKSIDCLSDRRPEVYGGLE